MWVEIGQLGVIRDLLENPEQDYIIVHHIFWYQPEERRWACVPAHPIRRGLLGDAQGPSVVSVPKITPKPQLDHGPHPPGVVQGSHQCTY